MNYLTGSGDLPKSPNLRASLNFQFSIFNFQLTTRPLMNLLPSTTIRRYMYSKIRHVKPETLLILLVILLGIFLRLFRLDIYPAGFHGDEGWTGIEAQRILRDGFIGFWSVAALGQAALSYYWTALIFYLGGASIESARFSFAILNSAVLPFYYLFLRKLFSRTTALIASTAFTLGYIPITFARRADFIAVSFSFFPALYFFIRAFETKSWKDFMLAGIFIGLSHHMYAGLWLAPLLFGLWTLYELAVRRKDATLFLIRTLAMVVVYLVVASPILYKAYTDPNSFFSRTKLVSIFSNTKHAQSYLPKEFTKSQLLLHNTYRTLGMFTHTTDPDVWNTFNRKPVFDPVSSVLFIAGLLLSIFFFSAKQKVYIWSILLFFLIPAVITVDAPSFRRGMVSIYISYVFVGFALAFLLQKTKQYMPKMSLISSVLVTGIVLGVSFYNSYLYFYQYAAGNAAKTVLAYPLVEVSKYINSKPQPLTVYFYSSRWSLRYETLQFLSPGLTGENRSKEFLPQAPTGEIKTPALFIFLPNYLNFVEEIEHQFPGGTKTNYYDTDGSIIFIGYHVASQ